MDLRIKNEEFDAALEVLVKMGIDHGLVAKLEPGYTTLYIDSEIDLNEFDSYLFDELSK